MFGMHVPWLCLSWQVIDGEPSSCDTGRSLKLETNTGQIQTSPTIPSTYSYRLAKALEITDSRVRGTGSLPFPGSGYPITIHAADGGSVACHDVLTLSPPYSSPWDLAVDSS